jgi:hypothetical protein
MHYCISDADLELLLQKPREVKKVVERVRCPENRLLLTWVGNDAIRMITDQERNPAEFDVPELVDAVAEDLGKYAGEVISEVLGHSVARSMVEQDIAKERE